MSAPASAVPSARTDASSENVTRLARLALVVSEPVLVAISAMRKSAIKALNTFCMANAVLVRQHRCDAEPDRHCYFDEIERFCILEINPALNPATRYRKRQTVTLNVKEECAAVRRERGSRQL